MACKKLGFKPDAFQRHGHAWFCTTGLPSDVIVEVGETTFHLHKFPLLSRSGVMEKLIADAAKQGCVVGLHDLPGGAHAFELVAKFCYGVRFELTASNAAHLRCAAEHLEMTEDYSEGNLISQTESFIDQLVRLGWSDTLRVLTSCDDVLPHAERLGIPRRCVESLAAQARADPNLFSWPITEPGGNMLWNGIGTVAHSKNPAASDWWHEDASTLSLPLYKQLISAMEAQGVGRETIAGSLHSYAKRYLPGLNRRKGPTVDHHPGGKVSLSEEDQRKLLEDIDKLLPMQRGLIPTKSLFGLLRTAKILKSESGCVSSLERRIGLQLEQASLEDLLMPNLAYSTETLYDVDCIQRILEHFLRMNRVVDDESPGSVDEDQLMGSSRSLIPITMVAKLVDGYLAEVASDVNLKLPKFQSLAAAVPEYARQLDDGLYCAIDIYLKSHPWLIEPDREQLCRLLDCQKLSLDACTHAAQNERLPLRVIVQVLFFEQLQLRTSIASCLLVSDNLDGSTQLGTGPMGPNENGWVGAVGENGVLKAGMDHMRTRVLELERECSSMRREIERMGKAKGSIAWGNMSRRFGFPAKSRVCGGDDGGVASERESSGGDVRSVRR